MMLFREFMCFIVVKQKTAYEMSISDWSSDVCSSDLFEQDVDATIAAVLHLAPQCCISGELGDTAGGDRRGDDAVRVAGIDADEVIADAHQFPAPVELRLRRSEEQTSELQSLMRTSYAVFCLKKQK